VKKKALLLGTMLGAMALAPQAFAQSSGLYSAFDLGYHQPENVTVTSALLGTTADVGMEGDWVGFARLGYRVAPNWRVEFEVGSRPGNVDEAGVSGNFSALSFMANALYDFTPDGSFSPFLGVGVGAVKGRLEAFSFPVVDVANDDTAFAYQALAGFSAPVSDQLTLDLTYRYIETSDFGFENTFLAGPLKVGYSDQSLTFGLRYSFQEEAAPPPPPPPHCRG